MDCSSRRQKQQINSSKRQAFLEKYALCCLGSRMEFSLQRLGRFFTLLSICLLGFANAGLGPSFVNLQSPNGIRWLTYESTYLHLLDSSTPEGKRLRGDLEVLLESGFCEPPISSNRNRNRACSLIHGTTIFLIVPGNPLNTEKKYHVSALAEALRPGWQNLQNRCLETLPGELCNRLNVEFEADGRPRCGFAFETKSGSRVLFLGGFSRGDLETCQ